MKKRDRIAKKRAKAERLAKRRAFSRWAQRMWPFANGREFKNAQQFLEMHCRLTVVLKRKSACQ